jgi:hypothetical protein
MDLDDNERETATRDLPVVRTGATQVRCSQWLATGLPGDVRAVRPVVDHHRRERNTAGLERRTRWHQADTRGEDDPGGIPARTRAEEVMKHRVSSGPSGLYGEDELQALGLVRQFLDGIADFHPADRGRLRRLAKEMHDSLYRIERGYRLNVGEPGTMEHP